MFTLYDTGPGTILDEMSGMFAPAAWEPRADASKFEVGTPRRGVRGRFGEPSPQPIAKSARCFSTGCSNIDVLALFGTRLTGRLNAGRGNWLRCRGWPSRRRRFSTNSGLDS